MNVSPGYRPGGPARAAAHATRLCQAQQRLVVVLRLTTVTTPAAPAAATAALASTAVASAGGGADGAAGGPGAAVRPERCSAGAAPEAVAINWDEHGFPSALRCRVTRRAVARRPVASSATNSSASKPVHHLSCHDLQRAFRSKAWRLLPDWRRRRGRLPGPTPIPPLLRRRGAGHLRDGQHVIRHGALSLWTLRRRRRGGGARQRQRPSRRSGLAALVHQRDSRVRLQEQRG